MIVSINAHKVIRNSNVCFSLISIIDGMNGVAAAAVGKYIYNMHVKRGKTNWFSNWYLQIDVSAHWAIQLVVSVAEMVVCSQI